MKTKNTLEKFAIKVFNDFQKFQDLKFTNIGEGDNNGTVTVKCSENEEATML